MDQGEPPQTLESLIEFSFLRTDLSAQDGFLAFGLLLIIGALLFFSALFSASENAFFSITPARKEELTAANDEVSNAACELINHPRKLLATILIGNNFVNVAIILTSSVLFAHLFNLGSFPLLAFILQVILVTFILVMLGEVIPKVYATTQGDKMIRIMARPLLLLRNILSPAIALLEGSGRLFGTHRYRPGKMVSSDELEAVIELTTEDNEQPHEKNMLKGIVNFGQKAVKEIMTPRMNMMALDVETDFEQLLERINEWGYSRIPVYQENLDSITGILFIKDLLPKIGADKDFDWRPLQRKPFFVPENKKIDDLLTDFKSKKVHLAIVVDEFGGTSGLVTMEDILEEIFGEINDEFDDEEFVYTKMDEHTFVFEGKISLNDLEKITGINLDDLDEVRGESDTLGGLILEITGELPKIGQIVEYGRFRFHIESVDRRRIKRVKFIETPQDVATAE